MTRVLAVEFPYESYDFGNGIPPILSTGTEVTDEQADLIGDLIAAMRPKVRPGITELTGVGQVEPPEVIFATQDWVNDAIAGIVAGSRPAIKFRQAAPAAQWIISHDRDNKPDVVLLTDDDGDERVYTDVAYPDDATVIVDWPAPTAGWAYIQ